MNFVIPVVKNCCLKKLRKDKLTGTCLEIALTFYIIVARARCSTSVLFLFRVNSDLQTRYVVLILSPICNALVRLTRMRTALAWTHGEAVQISLDDELTRSEGCEGKK